MKVGYVRPITLWPFPCDAVARRRAQGARVVGSFELSSGQMIDDVRIARRSARAPVDFIGGISTDALGLRRRPLLDVDEIRDAASRCTATEPTPSPSCPATSEW